MRDTENPRITPTDRVTHICRGKTRNKQKYFLLAKILKSKYELRILIHK